MFVSKVNHCTCICKKKKKKKKNKKKKKKKKDIKNSVPDGVVFFAFHFQHSVTE
jgi:hypothetical protein